MNPALNDLFRLWAIEAKGLFRWYEEGNGPDGLSYRLSTKKRPEGWDCYPAISVFNDKSEIELVENHLVRIRIPAADPDLFEKIQEYIDKCNSQISLGDIVCERTLANIPGIML